MADNETSSHHGDFEEPMERVLAPQESELLLYLCAFTELVHEVEEYLQCLESENQVAQLLDNGSRVSFLLMKQARVVKLETEVQRHRDNLNALLAQPVV